MTEEFTEEKFILLIEKTATYPPHRPAGIGWVEGKYFWYKHKDDIILSEEEELKILNIILSKEEY